MSIHLTARHVAESVLEAVKEKRLALQHGMTIEKATGERECAYRYVMEDGPLMVDGKHVGCGLGVAMTFDEADYCSGGDGAGIEDLLNSGRVTTPAEDRMTVINFQLKHDMLMVNRKGSNGIRHMVAFAKKVLNGYRSEELEDTFRT